MSKLHFSPKRGLPQTGIFHKRGFTTHGMFTHWDGCTTTETVPPLGQYSTTAGPVQYHSRVQTRNLAKTVDFSQNTGKTREFSQNTVKHGNLAKTREFSQNSGI